MRDLSNKPPLIDIHHQSVLLRDLLDGALVLEFENDGRCSLALVEAARDIARRVSDDLEDHPAGSAA